jgi:hypothetical protein
MTAVNLTKLNVEIYELLEFFTRPVEFHEHLTRLFSFYSVQVFRSGQTTQNNPRIKRYHLPLLIGMQFERLIRKRSQENPDAALRLFDELITDPYTEVCDLAASILGSIPATHAHAVLDRISTIGTAWQRDDRLLDFLQRSTAAIIARSSQIWLDYLEHTLPITIGDSPRFGLHLLQVSIQHESFVNTPFFFRHFLLFFPNADLRYRQDFLTIISELYRRYPTESLHFFEQSLLMVNNDAIFRIFRKFLPNLAESSRPRFREILKR